MRIENDLKLIPAKTRLRLRLQVGILLLLLAGVVAYAAWNIWSYVQVRHTSQARAIFAANGKRVVYLDGWAARASGKEVRSVYWPGRDAPGLLKATEGVLKDIRIDWRPTEGFFVRFTLASDETDSMEGELTARTLGAMIPLEQTIEIESYSLVEVVLLIVVLTAVVIFLLEVRPLARRMLLRAVSNRLARLQDPTVIEPRE